MRIVCDSPKTFEYQTDKNLHYGTIQIIDFSQSVKQTVHNSDASYH